MKKQTMYNRLQKQYTKLNQSIKKAMQTGRFYAYTQFKQQQLLSRLKRCSFQLKQLGAGVAVVGALGMATPMVGQNFIQRTGVDNPCDALIGVDERNATFVDIDGDGDLDCFTAYYPTGATDFVFNYYENVGDAYNADYVLQTGTNNPFDGITKEFDLSFVDIDGDGDLDCFSSSYGYNNQFSSTLNYYENTGSVTNPVFALQTVANNPLDIVRSTVGNGGQVSATFVDIDNDGDMDCFVGDSDYNNIASPSFLYYENTGSTTAPIFTQQTGGANPFSSINFSITSSNQVLVQFEDMDKDGDLDAFINSRFPASEYFKYYENTGNISTPTFVLSNTTPLDLINNFDVSKKYTLVDIDNDTDIDVIIGLEFDDTYLFWENQDSVFTSLSRVQEHTSKLVVSPNPTRGELFFEESISGRASVYTISGQLVLNLELLEAQSINLESLQNGLYFLEIQTEKGRIREKVILQK